MNTGWKAHPRLLFDEGELSVLREEAKRGLKSKILGRVLHLCRALMTPGNPNYLDFRERNSDVWKHRSGIFRVLPSLNLLATGYAFTGDSEIGEYARDALMAIIEHDLADVQSTAYGATNAGWRRGPGHDKGKFALSAAWVYDFCHDRFSSAQQQRVGEYGVECIHLAAEHGRFDINQVANNRGVRGLLSTALWAMVLEGDYPSELFEPCIKAAPQTIDLHLSLAYDPDGAPYEGPGYAQGCLAFIAIVAEMLRRRGGPNLLTNPRFEHHLEYLLYEMLPEGGSLNSLNDTHLPCGSVLGCLHLMGTPRGALIPWLASQLDFHSARASWLEGDELSLDSFDNLHPLLFLLWWKEDVQLQTPETLGYSVARTFPTRGVASMRTGWSTHDWLVSHFCGRQETKCHSQGDQNHIAFYAGGEHFLVDAGYGLPITDPKKAMDRWFAQTSAHNCVMIDGQEQRIGAHGKMLDFESNEDFDSSLGDASCCSGEYYLRRSLRRVILVRGEVPFVAILDVNEKDGNEFETECRWTTHEENRIEIAGNRFVIKGRALDCHSAVLWPQNAALALAESAGRPQLCVKICDTISEIVTVFCPLTRDAEVLPCFSCARESEGDFWIEYKRDEKTVRVRLKVM